MDYLKSPVNEYIGQTGSKSNIFDKKQKKLNLKIMKTKLLKNLKLFLLFIACSFIQNISLGQSPPNLGATSSFALFTAVGAFSNIGAATNVTGDVGTNAGAFNAFPPGTLVGNQHVADPTSAQAATAVAAAYSYLFGLTCDSIIGVTLGNGQVLTPKVYCIGAASTLNGVLTLNGQGDPDALFIFKINGALSTATFSNINLINSASLCNVFWQINGAFSLGDSSVFRGNIIANGQIELLEGSSLFGRGLSKAGAILLHNNLVGVGVQPAATITPGGTTTFCSGDSVTLSASVSNGVGPFSYLWSPGGKTDSSITVSPTVTTSYIVSVTAANGCASGKDTIAVTITPNDNASFSYSSSTFCQTGTDPSASITGLNGGVFSSTTGLVFLNTSTGLIDLSASTLGTYSVTYTTNGPCPNTSIVIITITTSPDAAFSYAGSYCSSAANPFPTFGTGASAGVFSSTTGLVFVSTLSGQVNLSASTPGTYTVTNTIAADGSCTAASAADTITINPLPNADAGIDKVLTCTSASISLSGSSSTAGAAFSWAASGGGHIVSGNLTATPIVDAAGVYTLTVTNPVNGCTAIDTANVTLNNTASNANAGPDKVLTCITTSIALSGSSSTAGAAFSWAASGGGNIVSGGNTATPTIDAAGIYTLTVTNPANGCTATDAANVTLNNTLPTVDLGNDTTFMNCHALPFILDADNQGAAYLWNTAETTQTITVSTSGIYYVEVTNSGDCTASDTINVTIINNNIDIDLGADTTVCECILLDAYTPGASYLWSTGGEYPIKNVCTTGTYWVTVSNGTCTDSDTIHITVNSPPVVDLGNDTILLVFGTLTLNAGNPGASYLWSTNETTQTITVSVSGQYYVTITNAFGCTASDTINADIPIGIKENAAADLRVNVSPNPSCDKTFALSFDIIKKTDVEIKIRNVLGRVVYSEKLEKFSGPYHKMITLKDMAGGIYFTDIYDGTQISTTKIILD